MNQQQNTNHLGNYQMSIVQNISVPTQQSQPVYYPIFFPSYNYGQNFIYQYPTQPNCEYSYYPQPIPMYVYNQQNSQAQNFQFRYTHSCAENQMGNQNQTQEISNVSFDSQHQGSHIPHNQNSELNIKNEEKMSKMQTITQIPHSSENDTFKDECEEKQKEDNVPKLRKVVDKDDQNMINQQIKTEKLVRSRNSFCQNNEQRVRKINKSNINHNIYENENSDIQENQNSESLDQEDYEEKIKQSKNKKEEEYSLFKEEKQKKVKKNFEQEQQLQIEKQEEFELFLKQIKPEEDLIISNVQNINVQNCFRNTLKELQDYVNNNYNYIYEYENLQNEKLNGKNLVNLPIVKIECPKQYNKKMFFQKFNKFIKSKKFNNQSIKQLVLNKLYSTLLRDFLYSQADCEVNNTTTASKEENKRFIEFLKICCQNNLFLSFLHRATFQYFKEQKSTQNQQNIQQPD